MILSHGRIGYHSLNRAVVRIIQYEHSHKKHMTMALDYEDFMEKK